MADEEAKTRGRKRKRTRSVDSNEFMESDDELPAGVKTRRSMTPAQRKISAQKIIRSKTQDRREGSEPKRLPYKLVPEEQIRLAKKITKNPWVQFGMFIGLFGLLVALVGQFGTISVLGAGFTQFMRSIGMFIVSSALMPLTHGVKQSVDKFMNGGEDFVEKKN